MLYFVISALVVLSFFHNSLEKLKSVLVFYVVTIFIKCIFIFAVWSWREELVETKEMADAENEYNPVSLATNGTSKTNQVGTSELENGASLQEG